MIRKTVYFIRLLLKIGWVEKWSLKIILQRLLAIINKLEKYNGCILADNVGLGKTFTALAVIKYYENRNKFVLVLCPKKLTNNWNTYKDNYDILLLRTSAILPEAISSGGLTPPLIQACFSPPIEVGVISQLIYIVNKERCICYARYTRG